MNVVCASHKRAKPRDSRSPPPTRKSVCAEKQKLCAPEQAAFRHVAYEEQKTVHEIGGKRSLAPAPISRCVPTSIAALAEVPIGSSDVSTVRMALTGGAVAQKAVSERFQSPAVGNIFKPALRDLAVREKVRTEIDRIYGAGTQADIRVEKDARLNTLVHILMDSNDQDRAKALTESLTPLPQTYRIETRSS